MTIFSLLVRLKNDIGWGTVYIPPIAEARWMGHPGGCVLDEYDKSNDDF